MALKKNFHHGDLRRALLDAALQILDSDGVGAVGIRSVARHAGVTHAAPVNHFKDLQALLTALAVELFKDVVTDALARLENIQASDHQRLDVFAAVLFDYGMAHPHRYDLLWRGDLIDHEDETLLSVTDQLYDALCSEIDQLPAKPAFDRDTIAVALWSMVHGYVNLRLTGMFELRDDEVTGAPRFEAMLDLFHHSLKSPPRTKS